MALRHYLLVFDHGQARLIHQEEFQDSREAVAAYSATEMQYKDNPSVEIVLIGSDSLDTVRVTHANYFDPAERSRFLEGVVPGRRAG
jgi:hypothetical protein